jgi:alpha-beta hydrolase superfamily lysophospholipase
VSRSVISTDGLRIDYDARLTGASLGVVVVPGFWRDRRHAAMESFGAFLSQLGYDVAIVDVRGHGSSEGRFGFNTREHVDVAAAAADFLASGSVRRISLIGFSVGGAIAATTAARHELPLASLLLISPVADMAAVIPRLNPFAMHRHLAARQVLRMPRFDWRLGFRRRLRAVDEISRVTVPVSLIHMENDWLVGHRHSERLFANAREPKELHILRVAGGYHADRIFSVAKMEAESLVAGFLESTLGRG